jgi:myo-inositol-1(or 4)-monophosphatase
VLKGRESFSLEIGRERKTATRAALKAGSLIRERVDGTKNIDYKSAFNLVTDVDKASEKLILEILGSEFPTDSILAEEGGGSTNASSTRRWLVDPLDGTTNFAHGYPFFAVSIGLEVNKKVVLGIVYNPMTDELFMAQKGKGAWLNDEPIRASSIANLSESLLSTGFPPDTGHAPFNNLKAFSHITALTHGVRRDGSAALDLCFVACGRTDGFWECRLAPWDIAAGSLIVSEAGGAVSNLQNGDLDISTGHILATNGLIHNELVQALANAPS